MKSKIFNVLCIVSAGVIALGSVFMFRSVPKASAIGYNDSDKSMFEYINYGDIYCSIHVPTYTNDIVTLSYLEGFGKTTSSTSTNNLTTISIGNETCKFEGIATSTTYSYPSKFNFTANHDKYYFEYYANFSLRALRDFFVITGLTVPVASDSHSVDVVIGLELVSISYDLSGITRNIVSTSFNYSAFVDEEDEYYNSSSNLWYFGFNNIPAFVSFLDGYPNYVFYGLSIELTHNTPVSASNYLPYVKMPYFTRNGYISLQDAYVLDAYRGYVNGAYEQGYNNGKVAGYNEGVALDIKSPVDLIFNTVTSFLNMAIFPNFYVYHLFLMGFGALLFGLFMKVVLGG